MKTTGEEVEGFAGRDCSELLVAKPCCGVGCTSEARWKSVCVSAYSAKPITTYWCHKHKEELARHNSWRVQWSEYISN